MCLVSGRSFKVSHPRTCCDPRDPGFPAMRPVPQFTIYVTLKGQNRRHRYHYGPDVADSH